MYAKMRGNYDDIVGCGRYDSNYQTTILLPKADMMYMEVGIRLLQ